MSWKIRGWMNGGYRAEREDGELVFIYRRPDWGTGLAGLKQFFELRNRGLLIGRLSREAAWRPRLNAEWLAGPDRPVSELDLIEIAASLGL